MVFGFFGKKKQEVEEEEVEIEPVSFLGTTSGEEVSLKPHGRLVEAGLMPSKDLVTDALSRRVDTIRIEPKGPQAVVTFLIDGIPYPGGKLPKTEGLAITQMLKVLAGLDSKERKKAQSGGIKAEFDSKKYLLGISSVGVADGERLTVRVTDMSIKLETPQELGMSEPMRVKLRELCAGNGLVVACGPSGSGTTTLRFALVRNVDAYMYNIFSMGDTEGRKLAHITAFEANEGDTFADAIQRAVRREANVLFCDPIKDADAAKAMLSKAGDVVLITEMSAKDAPSAVVQLVEWTGDPKLVAAGLKAVVMQKLIRKLCESCKQAYKPKADFVKKVGLPDGTSVLYRKPPETQDPNVETCEACGGVGYFGRVAMFEFLEASEEMQKLIAAGKPDPAAIRTQMKKDKMTTLQQDGLRLVAEGVTSLEELQRVFKPAG